MRLLPDLALQLRLKQWSRIFAGSAILIAVIVLCGWIFNVDSLRRLPGSSSAMNPFTAICFILASGSFFLHDSMRKTFRSYAPSLAWLVLVGGLMRMIAIMGNLDWSIDTFLFSSSILKDQPGIAYVRMAPNTAVAFILLGIALLVKQLNNQKYVKYFQLLAIIIGLNGWLLLLGYLYQAPSFFSSGFYGPMALYTSFGFIFISTALLLSRPDHGIMKPLTRLSGGGVAIRVMIPAAVIVPTLLGWLRMAGDWSGVYAPEFGVAVYTLTFIIIFLSISWVTAIIINRRDIQERKAEEALLKSEEELSAIFNGAPDAVVVIDEKSTVIRWNPEAEKLFQYTREEAIGRQMPELLIPEEFRNAHNKGMERFLQSGKGNILGKTIEIKALRKNGMMLDVALRISPIFLKGHYLFVGFIRDISEQKAMEAKLREFNIELKKQVDEKTKELTQIFERLTDGFIALDNDFRYTYMNRKAGQLIHRDPQTMIGKHVWTEFPLAVGSSTYHAFNKAIREKQYVVNIDRFEPLDIWQENHIYPSEQGLIVFIRDITEKKIAELALQANELRYRTFVEEAADAIMVYSPTEKRYVEVNKKAVELLGYSVEELLTKKPADLIFEDDKKPVPYEKLERGEAINIERVLKRKDGKSVIVETSAKKLPDGNYLAFIRDVTARKHAEEEMRRLNEELRVLTGHLNKVREDERTHIAREIHDELGQQLTVMKMDASWINKKLGPVDKVVQNKMDELLMMIDHTVKSIRRISSELRPSLLDDLGLIAAMEWHLDEFERRSGISKEFHQVNPIITMPDNIQINLFRIFQESLTNVARHSEATHVIVRIEQKNNQVILTIRDNGKGFDKDNSKKKTLGILGMKERTLMIGGEYNITGVAGAGTTVSVVIPVTNQIKQDNYA